MRVTSLAVAVCLSVVGFVAAQDAQAVARRSTNIPAQGLGPALQTLAQERGFQVVYLSDQVESIQTSGAVGEFSDSEALNQLLRGSGLTFRYLDKKTITVLRLMEGQQASLDAPTSSQSAADNSSQGADPEDIARPRATLGQSGAGTAGAAVNSEPAKEGLSEIVVTGTRLRGVKDQFTPVKKISRDDMDIGGFATVGDAIAALPQNSGGGVGGGVTPDTQRDGTAGAGARAINLRGLDVEATLTLLNGHRLAPSGLDGSFVDISAIPTAAIERIEVLTDGASAIYGSDAIAGVVNIILDDEYSGAETRVRAGTTTQGGGDELIVGQTIGTTWSRGRGLLSYEYGSRSEIMSEDRDFTSNAPAGDEVLPSVRRNSLFASGGLRLTDSAELSADAYFNQRDSEVFQSVDFGGGFFSTTSQDAKSDQYGLNIGLAVDLTESWRWQTSLSGARSEFDALTTNHSSAFEIDYESDTGISTAESLVNGSIGQLPGGPVQVVLGVHARDETFEGRQDFTFGFTPFDVDTDRDVLAAFAELYFPIVESATSGRDKFAITLAGRVEDYSDFGSTSNPKYGVLWSPLEGLTLRGTYATSFRAPRLSQLIDVVDFSYYADYIDPVASGGVSTAYVIEGFQSDLEPETSETWTAGFDIAPSRFEGFQARVTYFNINYDDRIAVPAIEFTGTAFANYALPVDRFPDPEEIAALIGQSGVFLDFTAAGGTTPDDVEVVLDRRPVNTASTQLDGVDLGVSQIMEQDFGELSIAFDASYILDFEDRFSTVTPTVSRVDLIGGPADLRFRAGVGFSAAAWSGSLFVNYVDDYVDDQQVAGDVKISSWTTVDATLRYEFAPEQDGFMSGVSILLNVGNLLDRDPPRVESSASTPGAAVRFFGYDPVNADPDGRRVAIQLSKAW